MRYLLDTDIVSDLVRHPYRRPAARELAEDMRNQRNQDEKMDNPFIVLWRQMAANGGSDVGA